MAKYYYDNLDGESNPRPSCRVKQNGLAIVKPREMRQLWNSLFNLMTNGYSDEDIKHAKLKKDFWARIVMAQEFDNIPLTNVAKLDANRNAVITPRDMLEIWKHIFTAMTSDFTDADINEADNMIAQWEALAN